jgi:hypothetical protein
MTANEILQKIRDSKYNIHGLRADSKNYNTGDNMPNSREWVDGTATDDYLNGTCAVFVDYDFLNDDATLTNIENALTQSSEYDGTSIYLIAGNKSEWGQDKNEIIIRNAIVL